MLNSQTEYKKSKVPMTKVLFVSAASGFSIISLQYYLHLNIANDFAGNIGIIYLGLCAILLLVARLLSADNLSNLLFLKKTDIYLLSFLLLVFLKVAFEHPDKRQLFAYSLGSSGGILFYLILGLLLGLNPLFLGGKLSANIFILGKKSNQNPFANLAKLIPSITIIFTSLFWTYQEFSFFNSSLRSDLFLVDIRLFGDNLSYQRMGDFICVKLIAVILLLVAAIFSHFEPKKFSIIYNVALLFDLFLTFCALILCILAFLTSLAIGSNKAAVISIFSLIIIIYLCATRHGFRALNISNQITLFFDASLRFKTVRAARYLIPSLAIFAPLMFILAVALSNSFFLQTRLTRFGDDFGALGPRIDILLSNTIVQFDVAPLIGNMYADGLSTGSGSYVHSLPVFLITHTGLLGLTLFSIFMIEHLKSISKSLILAYRNILVVPKGCRQRGQYIVQLVYGQIGLSVLLFVLAMAIVGTSLSWGFLWFAIGLSYGISRLRSDFFKDVLEGGKIT